MQLKFKPAIQRFIDEQVKTGRFADAEAVLEAGVARLMLDAADELDAEDLAAIAESDEQIGRGELLDWKVVSEQLYLSK